MNSNLRGRRSDIVILDEVSMAPLPSVYIAASRADSSVVVIGDPLQLAPIHLAESSEARKWLGTDLFTHRKIDLNGASRRYQNSVLLKEQSRMHPHISHIAREHIYKGHIEDSPRTTQRDSLEVEPLPEKTLLLCDTSDGSPVTMRPEGSSRINIYHALCTMELARQALKSLPPSHTHQLQSGEFRVGLVTPYRKQAELFQHLIRDAGLQNQVRAGTVHRFQGLEAEVIIFDTVDSPPISSSDFTTGRWGSDAMRLTNVAVTRAKHKLIIVAHSQYIQRTFPEDAILHLAVREAQKVGVLKSQEVLSNLASLNYPYTPDTERSSDTNKYESQLLDDRTFFDRLLADVARACKQIIIYSPFLSPQRTKQLVPLLSAKSKAGVRVIIVASSSTDSNPINSEAGRSLEKEGVELQVLSGMHEKFVFIDDDIVYRGSLNVLSHIATTEFMERTRSPYFAKGVRQFLKVDTIVAAPTKWGPNLEVLLNELPKATNCKDCSQILMPRTGKYGAFYGCSGYPSCKYTEEISESHLSDIQRLANLPCGGCGGPTKMKAQRKNAWVECSAPASCGFGQHINFSRSN